MTYHRLNLGPGLNDNCQQNRGRAWVIADSKAVGGSRSAYAVHMYCMLCGTAYFSHCNGIGKRRCPACQNGRASLPKQGGASDYSPPSERRRTMTAHDLREHLRRLDIDPSVNLTTALAAYDKAHGNETSATFNGHDGAQSEPETSPPELWQLHDVDPIDQRSDETPMSRHWGDTGHAAKAAAERAQAGTALISRDAWEKRFDAGAKAIADDDGAITDSELVDHMAACGRIAYLKAAGRAAESKQWSITSDATKEAWRAAVRAVQDVQRRHETFED